MPRVRKTLGLDRELVEKIKTVAMRRGMTLSEYLRRLLQITISLEEEGIFAPKLLEEARYNLIMSSLKFVYIPLDLLLDKRFSDEEISRARNHGERIGKVLSEMMIDVYPLVEKIGEILGVSFKKGDDLVFIKSLDNDYRRFILEFIIGVATGNGYIVNETNQLILIRKREI
ncbi:MAG: hypothetical protein ACP5I7_01585 [Sulfolobales archaeon]